MAIRFSGNITDHLMAALMGVVVQQGWDYAKQWLTAQGVPAERVAAAPAQLPPAHPYHYLEYMNGVYYWHFFDRQRGLHVRLRSVYYVTPQGPVYKWEVV